MDAPEAPASTTPAAAPTSVDASAAVSTRTTADAPVASTSQPTTLAGEAPARSQVDVDLETLKASIGNVGTSLSAFGGSLWGRVRAQGESALAASRRELEQLNEAAAREIAELNDYARKDIVPLVTKAQDELKRLGDQAKASVAAGQAVATGSSPTPTPTGAPDVSFFGESVSMPPAAETSPGERTSPLLGAPGTASAFFNRLQTQISSNASLSQLQAQLADRQKLAEGYLSKAGDYLNQAVRVVPPVASGSGTDAQSQRAATIAAGRKDGLLAKLRAGSAAVLAIDPAQPPPAGVTTDAREAYALFLQSVEDKGGLESADWQQRVAAEQALPDPDGPALRSALASLGTCAALSPLLTPSVPSQMPAEAFWSRYFFRVQQIEDDEAKRRLVLQGADAAEDDFKWDDDEADEVAPAPAPAKADIAAKDVAAASPRNSSDEGTAVTTSSYDMVSRNASGSESGARPKASTAPPADDDDEDWE